MTTVNAPAGPIAGAEQDGLHVFKGIPFAQPPVGARRWLAPAPLKPWTETLDATSFGPQAMQAAVTPLTGLLGGVQEGIEFSEDCLTLNIWTAGCDAEKRPVMVWIHGGAFVMGSGSSPMYDGTAFAERGVVLVSINYRLGTLGFLSLDDVTGGAIPSAGCEGLLDQIQALNWVRQNIAAFGGDPDSVTIFGESAGGMSVGCLMTMPSANALYHRAIPQSGACHTASSRERGQSIARLTAEALNIDPSDASAWRALTADQLIGVQDAVQANPETGGNMPFMPVVDGKHLPRFPIDAIRGGAAAGKDVLVGSTLEETRLFTAMGPDGGAPGIDQIKAQTAAQFGDDLGAAMIEGYTAALTQSDREPTAETLGAVIGSDRMFRVPAIRLAEAQLQNSANVYVYLFDWTTDFLDHKLGACHALELPFVFGTHQQPGLSPFAGASQPGADELSAAMLDAWSNFARSGNPGGAAPVASYAGKRNTLVFGRDCRSEDDALGAVRTLWDGNDDYLGSMG